MLQLRKTWPSSNMVIWYAPLGQTLRLPIGNGRVCLSLRPSAGVRLSSRTITSCNCDGNGCESEPRGSKDRTLLLNLSWCNKSDHTSSVFASHHHLIHSCFTAVTRLYLHLFLSHAPFTLFGCWRPREQTRLIKRTPEGQIRKIWILRRADSLKTHGFQPTW